VTRRGVGRLLLLALLVVTFALGAFACGQTSIVPIKEPDACKLQLVDMTILASPRINLTEAGQARPVQVRVYQLASDVKLNNADFMDIWKDDKKALGEDLMKVQEFPVYPDSRTDVHFERDEKALIIAVVAIFRSPKGRSWYSTWELPPAPGKGNCYSKDCKDGNCEDAGPKLNPRFVAWIDGTRVDTGEDKLEAYPSPGRHQDFSAPPAVPTLPDMPAAPTEPAGPALPAAPTLPTGPALPGGSS
jgi:type VI secretion system protein VasD